jgi:hypothetical protein
VSKKRSRPAVHRAVERRQRAPARAGDERARKTGEQPSSGQASNGKTSDGTTWQTLQRAFAVLGALSTLAPLIAVGIGLVNHFVTSTETYKREQEERLVSRLVPGQDSLRIVQIIGGTPDYGRKLPSGNTLYQYRRQWEDLQLLVDPDGRVLSVGVYAISTDFHPALRLGGYPLTLNRSQVVFPQERPAVANGYCGARPTTPCPTRTRAQSLVSGVSDATSTAVDVHDVCKIADVCQIFLQDNEVSAQYVNCVVASPEPSRLRSHLTASVLIVTAPGQDVIGDMLWPPDDVGSFLQPSP